MTTTTITQQGEEGLEEFGFFARARAARAPLPKNVPNLHVTFTVCIPSLPSPSPPPDYYHLVVLWAGSVPFVAGRVWVCCAI